MKHVYSNKERHIIYKSATVKNSTTKQVPKEKAATKSRRKIINDCIKTLKKTFIFCKALNDYVEITKISQSEVRNWGGINKKSTIAVLNIHNIVNNATYIYSTNPKDNKKQQAFKKMHILICPIKGVGYAKITIGEVIKKKITPYTLYSITHISLIKIKNRK